MLGETLTTLRKQKKLTQEQVAEKLHISRATYAQYEINRRVPEYLTLEKLADYFEVTIDHLVGREVKETSIEETEMDSMKREIREIVNAAQTDEDVKSILHIVKKVMKE